MAVLRVIDVDTPDTINTLEAVVRSRPAVARALESAGQPVDDAAIDELAAATSVEVAESKLVTIKVAGESATAAAAAANALADAYVEFTVGRMRDAAEMGLRQAEEEHRLEAEALTRLEREIANRQVVSPPADTSDAARKRILTELAAAREERDRLDGIVRQISASRTPLGAAPVSGDAKLQELHAQLLLLRERRIELSTRFGAVHPQVVDFDVEIDRRYREIDRLAPAVAAIFRQEQQAAREQEQTLLLDLQAIDRTRALAEQRLDEVSVLEERVREQRTRVNAARARAMAYRQVVATVRPMAFVVEEAVPPAGGDRRTGVTPVALAMTGALGLAAVGGIRRRIVRRRATLLLPSAPAVRRLSSSAARRSASCDRR